MFARSLTALTLVASALTACGPEGDPEARSNAEALLEGSLRAPIQLDPDFALQPRLMLEGEPRPVIEPAPSPALDDLVVVGLDEVPNPLPREGSGSGRPGPRIELRVRPDWAPRLEPVRMTLTPIACAHGDRAAIEPVELELVGRGEVSLDLPAGCFAVEAVLEKPGLAAAECLSRQRIALPAVDGEVPGYRLDLTLACD